MTFSTLSSLLKRDFVHMTKSGSFAIISALQVSGLPKDSKVIMPAICCPAVFASIQLAGFIPVIADVNPETFCMEVEDIRKVFEEDCKVVIAVHAYGRNCNLSAINSFCRLNKLLLIEDACLSSIYDNSEDVVGSIGDFTVTSFGRGKPLDCNGGGALLTNNSIFSDGIAKFLEKIHI